MRRVSVLPTVLTFLLSIAITGLASAGSITYDLVNYPAYQNGYTLSGFITTDGTTGTLEASDITAWTVTMSFSTTSETFSSDQPYSILFAGSVAATASQIYLGTQGESNAAFLSLIGPPFGATEQIDWVQSTSYSYYVAELPGYGLTWQSYPPFSGTNFVIATASVPEPSELTLLGIAGTGLAIFARRRSRRG